MACALGGAVSPLGETELPICVLVRAGPGTVRHELFEAE